MAALGFSFIVLPCLAIVSFTCSAACRAQQHRAFKVLAYVCLSVGLVCGLTPIAVLVHASTLAPSGALSSADMRKAPHRLR